MTPEGLLDSAWRRADARGDLAVGEALLPERDRIRLRLWLHPWPY